MNRYITAPIHPHFSRHLERNPSEIKSIHCYTSELQQKLNIDIRLHDELYSAPVSQGAWTRLVKQFHICEC